MDGGREMEKLVFNNDRLNVLAAYAKEKLTKKHKFIRFCHGHLSERNYSNHRQAEQEK